MSIQDLIDLQNIDSELNEIEDLLGDLPSKVFKNEENRFKSIEEGKKKIVFRLEIKSYTGNVNLLIDKIDKQKDQFFSYK